MITVKLLCFGITKDIIGTFEKSLDVSVGCSVYAFLTKLKQDFPELERLNSLRIAVNEEYVQDTFVLNHRDEVVLIPPVSGG
ncbi:MAG TPA: MoaD/ThiS family protein [Leadbetterella sp.]|nr:MoaD/ThiS family protein [Leadbetterella sp.]